MIRHSAVFAASVCFSLLAFAQPQAKDVVNAGKKPALTQEQYKKLILGLESCKLVGYSIDPACQGSKDLSEAMKNSTTAIKDLGGMNAALGRELISHPSPAIRVKAANLTGGLLGTSDASEEVVTAAAEKEADPAVLQAFIRVVANSGAKNKKVAAMLFKASSHADVKVRKQAVFAIASSWNREMEGGAEKLLEIAGKDADPSVRAAACEYAGTLGNKILLPFMEKNTDKSADLNMYNACMKGLVKMFHEYPLYGTSNEAAYNLFLKRLGEKPRSDSRPFWIVTSAFESANDQTNKSLAQWKTEAKWFKPAEVKKTLADLIADKNATWLSRSGAVKSMFGLGATKAELEALKKGYDPKVANDQSVLKVIDEMIAKAT